MEEYELILTSYPDCDDFVVEMWFENNLIAIVKENNEIQLFHDKADKTTFESSEFISALKRAKEKLGIKYS